MSECEQAWRPLPIRPPRLDVDFVGPRAWRRLHELAEQRDRHPRDQILHLARWALKQDLDGVDVELSRSEIEALQGSSEDEPDPDRALVA